MKKSFPHIFVIISIVLFSIVFFIPQHAHAAEELRAVYEDMTLDPDVEYTVSGTVYINGGNTLTVPAGTSITFGPNARLVVYGKLNVEGTSQHHVVFQSGPVSSSFHQMVVPIETPEVEEDDTSTATPEVEELEIAPLSVSMGNESSASSDNRALEIVFINGSEPSSLSYLELTDFAQGMMIDTNAVVTADHVTFTRCDKGIENSFGTLTLTHARFVDTAVPGLIAVNATFEHSDTTFSGTGFKGWNYTGKVSGEVHLRSKDGEYYALGLEVLHGGSLYFNYGTTVYIQDSSSLLVDERSSLFISGTEASPVTIYGNGSCPLQLPAIKQLFESTVTIRHANFHDLCAGVFAINATVDISDSTFKNIAGSAIKLIQAGDITVTDTDITKSGIAIELEQAEIKNISQNHFHDNTIGVSIKDVYPSAVIKNNGWGSNTGPKISDNPGGTGDSIVVHGTPQVLYRPWLGMDDDTPPDTAPDPEIPDVPPIAGDHDPIIIVPGITGSVLSKGYDDHSELWPNLTKLIANLADSQLDDLALLQTGKESSVRPLAVGDIIRSVSSVDIFKGLIQFLGNAGYVEGTNLFVLPYDWRLSNATNQVLLKDMVAQALQKSGKQKVQIIAHSMGGLLVKEYVAENPTAPIDNIFNIAVPYLGAPKTFKTLMYGDDMGFTVPLIATLKVPVLNENRVKMITQNMPSVYELLPSKAFIDLFGPYIDDRTQSLAMDIDGVKKVMLADGRNERMFPFAQTLHDKIDGVVNFHIPTYNFAGCGSTKTVTGFTLTKEQSLTLTGFKLVPEHRLWYGAGDGVVPVASATALPGANNYYVASGSHGTMPSVSAVQNAILSVLQGNSIVTNAGVSNTTGICSVAGTVVEVHSPVALHIYDEQGRHTGPTDDGEIEYGIPNVQYDVIDNEKSVFLPEGNTYTVSTHAESTGEYDMYISYSDQHDIITHQSYYHAVPLPSENSVGTFTVGQGTTDPVISIDDNSDTVIDRTVSASSSLTESKTGDTVAPVTTATLDGTTVTLTATDDSAGVLNTKYSTDNITWNVYTEPFNIVPDATIYFVSIDNAGNTEDIKELSTRRTESAIGVAAVAPATPTSIHASEIVKDTVVKKNNAIVETPQTPSSINISTPSYLTAPAPDEGTVMSDNEITRNSLIASAGAVAAAGHTTILAIGVLAVVGIGLFLIFSKKPM